MLPNKGYIYVSSPMISFYHLMPYQKRLGLTLINFKAIILHAASIRSLQPYRKGTCRIHHTPPRSILKDIRQDSGNTNQTNINVDLRYVKD